MLGFLRRLYGYRQDPPIESAPRVEDSEQPLAETPLEVLQRSLASVRVAAEEEDRRLRSVTEDERRILEAVEERRELVRKNGLDHALCWLFNEIQHYPAWSKREDAGRWIKLPVDQVEGGEDPELGKMIRFTLRGIPLEIRLKVWPQFGPHDGTKQFADLSLVDSSGTVLLGLRVSRDLSEECVTWGPSKVVAFRVGEWALHIAELYFSNEKARVRAIDHSVSGVSRIEELRNSFGLS